jgi:hypothetical protein
MGRNKVRVPRARLTCHLVIFVSTLIAISVVLSDCTKQPKPVVGTGEIAPSISKATYDAYRQGGWVPLVEPDSRFVPGTIFETKENTAPRWIYSLETCGFPKKVLAPLNNDTGTFKYSGDANYGAKAVLNIRVSIKADVLKLSADANAKVPRDSSLSLTVPVYTAVHQAIYAKDVLRTLTQPSRGLVKHADDAILPKLPY